MRPFLALTLRDGFDGGNHWGEGAVGILGGRAERKRAGKPEGVVKTWSLLDPGLGESCRVYLNG